MIQTLRKPFLVLALIVCVLALLVEVGSDRLDVGDAPGFGVPYLAMVDVLLALTLAFMVVTILIGERFEGRLQGIVTLLVSFAVVGLSFAAIMRAFVELLIMLVLAASPPFGWAAYVAIYGDFDRSTARMLLGLSFLLKVGLGVLAILAHQRYLKQIGFVLLVATSIVAGIVVAFLHGLVPGILASITDAIAGIVVGIVALIWAIVFLIISIVSIVKAMRLGARREREA